MDFSKYRNFFPYPDERKIIKQHVDHVKTTFVGDHGELVKALEEAETEGKELCRKQRNKYNTENARLNDLFKEDLEKEFGLENHPKKEIIFGKASERSRLNGIRNIDVYDAYEELSEFLTNPHFSSLYFEIHGIVE